MYQNLLKLAITIIMTLTLTACADSVSPNTYHADSAGVVARVVKGTIIQRRLVTINNNSRVGGVAGTAAGAVAGSSLGGDGATGLLSGIAGAVVGGVAGDMVDKNIHKNKAYEYIIKLKRNGDMISVAQTLDIDLANGEKVLVIYGDKTRIVPDSIDGKPAIPVKK